MAFFDRLFPSRARLDYLATPDKTVLASPWAESSGVLQTVIAAEALGFDIENAPLDRNQALLIPSVAKVRNLLVSSIAGTPLTALNKEGPLANQPTWLYRSDRGFQAPYNRMAATVDDLLFFGVSLWLTTRGAEGQILRAEWTARSTWTIENGEIVLDRSRVLTDEEYILFEVPLYSGLLTHGARTLRTAQDTAVLVSTRVRSTIPLNEFKITDGTKYDQEELQEWVATAEKRYNTGNGRNFIVTPDGTEIKRHDGSSSEGGLFLEQRNAERMDVAAHANIPGPMVDASLSTASLTYSTVEGNRSLFYDQLAFWIDPIESALSQDKCVPMGSRVRFSRAEETAPIPNPTGEPVDD